MKKEFVTYKIALKLKELGFNEECFGFYKTSLNDTDPELNIIVCNYNSGKYITIPEEFHEDAPLWQQAIDFFREKYDIHVSVPNYYDGWKIDIRGFKQNINLGYQSKPGLCLENYYDAREEAILKAIELVQNKPV